MQESHFTCWSYIWHLQLPDYTLSIDLGTEMLIAPKEDPQGQHECPRKRKYKEL